MIVKRNLFFTLFSLLVFLTANSSGILSKHISSPEPVKIFCVSEKNAASGDNETISSINELSGFLVKGNEGSYSGFQNLQNSKKYLATNLALRTTNSFIAFYSSYCHKRTNSVHHTPFYISYHRLTI